MAQLPPLLPPANAIVQESVKPSTAFFQYLFALDKLIRTWSGGNIALVAAVDDVAAAAAGVPVFGFYQNAGAVRQRLT